jgi:hypothetical protein
LPGRTHRIPLPELPAAVYTDYWNDEEADEDTGATDHVIDCPLDDPGLESMFVGRR